METVGVLGTGMMGAGIVQVVAQAAYRVVACDRSVVLSTPGARFGSTMPSPRSAAFMMLNEAVAMPRPSERPTIVSRRIAG